MNSPSKKLKVGMVFGKWLPYHFARYREAQMVFNDAGHILYGIQYSKGSGDYGEFADQADSDISSEFVSLDIAQNETDFNVVNVVVLWQAALRNLQLDVVFLPSYGNWSLTMRVVCWLMGCKVIMMNESHGGTEKAKGLKRLIKQLVVSSFDGALVGGEPHRRHFFELGIDPQRIVTGYDAVDNGYFIRSSDAARSDVESLRARLMLPRRYLLSLGRMVEKKNLAVLVDAYAEVKEVRPDTDLKLVFVGSGECQSELIQRCEGHGLSCMLVPKVETFGNSDVFFYGFRQIDENPIFYGLAEAFVLPSKYEEWGLVVNEAMACSLPVLVSFTVGSAEDLVLPGVNGFHFDPNSASQLAKHILFLLDHPLERERMGAASLERIKDWGCENFAKQACLIAAQVRRS